MSERKYKLICRYNYGVCGIIIDSWKQTYELLRNSKMFNLNDIWLYNYTYLNLYRAFINIKLISELANQESKENLKNMCDQKIVISDQELKKIQNNTDLILDNISRGNKNIIVILKSLDNTWIQQLFSQIPMLQSEDLKIYLQLKDLYHKQRNFYIPLLMTNLFKMEQLIESHGNLKENLGGKIGTNTYI